MLDGLAAHGLLDAVIEALEPEWKRARYTYPLLFVNRTISEAASRALLARVSLRHRDQVDSLVSLL